MKSSSKQVESPNYVLISIFIGIIYLFVHLGFYKTYWVHFPDFKGFELLHHIHGMLMGKLVVAADHSALAYPVWQIQGAPFSW